MILLPAVDIRDGRAVRLRQGDFDDETVYADNPLDAARSFTEAGARFLHVVDLDGAKQGSPANLHHLERIAGELGVPVQFGGGLRSAQSVQQAIDAGARRVVLGTAAFTDEDLLAEVVATHGDRIAVAVDVRGGYVSVAGWTQVTKMLPEEVTRSMQLRGVERFVFTNVDVDGMLGGLDLAGIVRFSESLEEGAFIYSGGVGSVEDLRALRDLGLGNLGGVICGKALYERRFTVAEGEEALA